jgi:phage terminase Nu1 subunit (DNA packaging protein)
MGMAVTAPKKTVRTAKSTATVKAAGTKKKTEKKELVKKLVRVEVLAQFVGVTVRRIQQLQQEGVIKPEPVKNKKEGAQYDFLPCLHNLITYYRDKAERRKSGDSADMEKEKLSHLTIKRETEELKLKQIKGELHKAEDIERVMGAGLTRLRINLLAIPMGVAPLVRVKKDVNEIAEILNERICRALNEIATIDIKKLILAEKEG